MRISQRTVGWIVFFLLAVYYYANRYPGLAFIDSGELALCAGTFGVPHPTGYPLYVALTAPVTVLFHRPIVAVTIFSGLLTALAGMAFFHLTANIRNHLFPDFDKGHMVSALATGVLFLSPVVAEQGVTNEVYGLALLVNLMVILAAAGMLITKNRPAQTRYLVLAWYGAGLALCNHMNSVQLLPGLLILTLVHLRRRPSLPVIGLTIAAFAIPLTMYAILPIRAGADVPPVANWGDVTSWANLRRHVSGWQFQVWMFTGEAGKIWANFKQFADLVLDQYPPIILPLSAAGIYHLLRRRGLLAAVFLAAIIVNVGLGINYSIPDIESYYLLTYASVLLFGFVGLFHLRRFMRSTYLPPLAALGLLAWQTAIVYDGNYRRDYTLPEDYARNIGRSAVQGAVVMSELWDHHAQAFYLQQAEDVRPDLKFVDKELLRRSWYFKTIQAVYPDLYAGIADLVPPYLEELAVFESGGRYNSEVLEYYFQAIINRLLTACGPAYIDYQLRYSPRGSHYLRPQGVLYRLDTIPVNAQLPQPRLEWRGRPLEAYTDWRARHHVDMISEMTGPP